MRRRQGDANDVTFHQVDGERSDVLLDLRDVVVRYGGGTFGLGSGSAPAVVDEVSLLLKTRQSIGLVGESGCGKTSLGRSILGLAPLVGGSISVAERTSLYAPRARASRRLARSVQVVFQDPYSSLDPRQSVRSVIEEPLVVNRIGTGAERASRVDALLEKVGLSSHVGTRFPHELSGGQRQRVCIARALAVEPLVLICDEPTSALDVSIQAQIVELLRQLQHDDGLTYLFITHDLALLPQIVTAAAVMYLGRLVEVGPVMEVLRAPRHPYTASLIAAAPVLGRRRAEAATMLRGELPSGVSAGGCPFRSRCWLAAGLPAQDVARCETQRPALVASADQPERRVACHFADRVAEMDAAVAAPAR